MTPKVNLQPKSVLDKNCQENENIQMRPKKPKIHMWSMTNTDDIWLSSNQQQLEDYVKTRTVNLQDVTVPRKESSETNVW